MGAVRKVVSYLGLGGIDHYDDGYDDEQYEEDYMPAAERAARRWRSTADSSRIVMVQPLKYNDAPMIGQHFREGQTVIMDVTGMPMPEATRMVDFAAGLAYGCEGRIERIADRVFLLAPAHVEIESS
ncbi:cell division protein SepF [Nonomuraea sp. NEAU-A123]|uniref:cell division protein SepF n=1 Tax=Nonomuraea sp. NEAU-A123 TaxID=2839649 RepID=UPI001BE44294|nr:cell division protein SepF [Nonomuraea sp. NEAU-A123]MBT2235590.1 cell division protein SepF [Nonomuraea sp. NEAU-A123]